MLRFSGCVLYNSALKSEMHIRIYGRIEHFITFLAVQRS